MWVKLSPGPKEGWTEHQGTDCKLFIFYKILCSSLFPDKKLPNFFYLQVSKWTLYIYFFRYEAFSIQVSDEGI